MKIQKMIMVANYDGTILGGFNEWCEAKEFMCKHYLETLDINNLPPTTNYYNISMLISNDLNQICCNGFCDDVYYTEEITLDIEY